MQNVTIAVDPEVAQWARIWAARHNTSVSRMVGEMLASKMRDEDAYTVAMEDYLNASRGAQFPLLPGVGEAADSPRFGTRDQWHLR